MLLIETETSGPVTVLMIIQIVITSVIGIFGLSAALEGYCFSKMNMVVRFAIAAGGLLLIHPALTTDIIGLLIVVLLLFFQFIMGKKEKEERESIAEV